MTDEDWMRDALERAATARDQNEIPVGAILVKDERCIGQGWNRPISSHDPTAHAEIVAIRQAGETLGDYRLSGSSLYVTLEPCVMCIGAIVHARVERLIFGAFDPARGAVCSALNVANAAFFNHKVKWQGGVLAAECTVILKRFFEQRRKLQHGFVET